MPIKSFIINLPESTQRRAFMETQMQFFPELNYEFFNATDARKMSDEQINQVYDYKAAFKTLGREMVRGEIGVALSQLSVMQKIVLQKEIALIMEDDLLISPYFSESLAKAVKFIEKETPRIVLFTPAPQYSSLDPIVINAAQKRAIYKVWKDASCAACYLINATACEIILKEYQVIHNVIDNWGYFIRNSKIDIRVVVPHVVAFSKHGLSMSTIDVHKNRDEKVYSVVHTTSFYKRLKNKFINIYQNRKFKVIRNYQNVWYNSGDLIQPNF